MDHNKASRIWWPSLQDKGMHNSKSFSNEERCGSDGLEKSQIWSLGPTKPRKPVDIKTTGMIELQQKNNIPTSCCSNSYRVLCFHQDSSSAFTPLFLVFLFFLFHNGWNPLRGLRLGTFPARRLMTKLPEVSTHDARTGAATRSERARPGLAARGAIPWVHLRNHNLLYNNDKKRTHESLFLKITKLWQWAICATRGLKPKSFPSTSGAMSQTNSYRADIYSMYLYICIYIYI